MLFCFFFCSVVCLFVVGVFMYIYCGSGEISTRDINKFLSRKSIILNLVYTASGKYICAKNNVKEAFGDEF